MNTTTQTGAFAPQPCMPSPHKEWAGDTDLQVAFSAGIMIFISKFYHYEIFFLNNPYDAFFCWLH